MNAFSDLVDEERRLVVLQSLAAATGYTLPEGAAREALRRAGLAVSADAMAIATAWLDEARLLVRRTVGATAVLTLTMRGLDCAEGVAQVPGVARPRPGA